MKQWTEKLKHNLDSVQTHAYNLKRALRLEAEASKALLEAEEALENAIAQATADGRVFGRNREEREARARILFPDLYGRVLEAKKNHLEARARLEGIRAQLQAALALIEASKTLLRHEEIKLEHMRKQEGVW